MKKYFKAFWYLIDELRVVLFFAGLVAAGTVFGGLGFLVYLVLFFLGINYSGQLQKVKREEAAKRAKA